MIPFSQGFDDAGDFTLIGRCTQTSFSLGPLSLHHLTAHSGLACEFLVCIASLWRSLHGAVCSAASGTVVTGLLMQGAVQSQAQSDVLPQHCCSRGDWHWAAADIRAAACERPLAPGHAPLQHLRQAPCQVPLICGDYFAARYLWTEHLCVGRFKALEWLQAGVSTVPCLRKGSWRRCVVQVWWR